MTSQQAHVRGKIVAFNLTGNILGSLLEAESTPVPECGRKDYANKKFQWHYQETNPSGLQWRIQPTVSMYAPKIYTGQYVF